MTEETSGLLRAGDTIKCRDDEDLRDTLKDLSDYGVHTVVWDRDRHIIIITQDEEARP